MKAATAIALFAYVTTFFAGCAGPRSSSTAEDFKSILFHYNTQSYDRCLSEIEVTLGKKLLDGQRALLLMTKSMCEDELGQKAAATATLVSIKSEFPHTSFADRAQVRLDKKDGDQREHVELDLNDPGWQRAAKQFHEKGVRQYFFPVGETPKQHTIKLAIISQDRLGNTQTLDDAVARAGAEFSLRGGIAKPRLIERSINEGYWEAEETSPEHLGSSVSLARVILTDTRIHIVEFTFRKPVLTTEERQKYLLILKRAKLVSTK